MHDYYNRVEIVFKENSGLTLVTESTKVVFNPIFINVLDEDLTILVEYNLIEKPEQLLIWLIW